MEYLNEEDQFKDILNDEEISRIKDPKLREIRMRFWVQRRNAFIDEHNVSDKEIGNLIKKLIEQEQKEIDRFRTLRL